MELTFVNPGIEYMLERIMEFQAAHTSSFWADPLFHFYPQLSKEHALALPYDKRSRYLSQELRQIYPSIKNTIDRKVPLYALRWDACKGQITAALSEAFDCDCDAILNDMQCRVSMNPIEPRFLTEHAFDIFYLNSEKGAIGEAIHEIIHLVWFHVWHDLFGDSWDEYESPSLKWILSEMVVESIMRDNRLSSINPYFPREKGGCIYPYFFTMKTDNRPTLDVLDTMYHSCSIGEFMRKSYAYCQKHEQEIRRHIKQSENRVIGLLR